MNGSDLVDNLIDELERAKDLLYLQNPDESSEEAILINDIKADLDRYYDVAEVINDTVNQVIAEYLLDSHIEKNMGICMKSLKFKFGALLDSKVASEVVKEYIK